VGVAPHVHGLLLTPQELSVGVPPQLPLYEVKGEGHQLHTHTHMHMSWNVCRCVHTLYQVIREGHQLHIDTHTDTQKHTHVSNTCLCTDSVPGQREVHQQQTHRHEDRQQTHIHAHTYLCACTEVVRCNVPGGQLPSAQEILVAVKSDRLGASIKQRHVKRRGAREEEGEELQRQGFCRYQVRDGRQTDEEHQDRDRTVIPGP